MSNAQKEEIIALRLENERLTEALKECVELMKLQDPDGVRARKIAAPEDPEIKELCERVGYGAVMDSASRQWRTRNDGTSHVGAFTVGCCVGVVQMTLKKALAALEKKP